MGFSLNPLHYLAEGTNYVHDLVAPKPTDTTPVKNAAADASARADDFDIERRMKQAMPAAAPQVTGASIEPPRLVTLPPAPPAPPAPPPNGMAQNFGTGNGRSSATPPPATPAPPPGGMVDGLPPPNYIDPIRQRQLSALDLLADAAAGKTPSAAELASKAAADRAAAQQFGIAAALQGSMSPGAALRQASEGSAGILSTNATDLGTLRAKETADARNSLVTGLGGVRSEEDKLATDQARMNLDAQITNAKLQLESRGLDQQTIHDLLMARLQEEGYSVELSKAIVDGNAKNAAADNAFKAQLINLPVAAATAVK